jgi:hypothetical protein
MNMKIRNSCATLSPGTKVRCITSSLETKRQAMEYHNKGSPTPKKFKTAPSADKVMLNAS